MGNLITSLGRGAAAGAASTVALSGFRRVLAWTNLVHETAPEQVVGRLDELGLLNGWSAGAKRALTLTAHVLYGTGIGAGMGFLREGSPRAERTGEVAVGSALGILSWGVGWTTVMPLIGAHRPPWRQSGPRVLLPVVDHAFFGAVWGLLFRRPV
jgi:hypothetical protein